ncbi:PRC-barrel domain-containing protein [Rubinisphaera margarita]|uniref:PRC-barrel domain-containing protein n=1 Tax=Rubinisphaera margarita TaxID=2909586 RepID=UPI001EE8C0C4|nr:PRC-barrel domain-containing protein [Rubinisphaera margarita]MCG6156090.1 PRC-barrel domain-containing protein [Rubinisphaera margarita]
MKRLQSVTAGIAMMAVFGLMTSAHAEQPARAAAEGQGAQQYVPTSQIIGAGIRDANNEQIANVDDLVMNRQGKVQYVIAGVGGLAGLGESQVAIPVESLQCQCTTEDGERECYMTISMTQEKLSEAPKLEKENHAELFDTAWISQNRSYFSAKSAENAQARRAGSLVLHSNLNDVYLNTPNEEEDQGQIDDLVVDTAEHKVKFAIIGLGGTLGVGENYVAVPFEALQLRLNEDNAFEVSTNMTVEQLKAAPKVTSPDYVELQGDEFRNQIKNLKSDRPARTPRNP